MAAVKKGRTRAAAGSHHSSGPLTSTGADRSRERGGGDPRRGSFLRRIGKSASRRVARVRKTIQRNKEILSVAAILIALASLAISGGALAWNVWSGMLARPTLRVEQTLALPGTGGSKVEREGFSVGSALLLTNPTTNPLTVTDFYMLHDPVVEDGVRTLRFGGWSLGGSLPARLEAGGATVLPIRFMFGHEGKGQAFARVYRPKLRLLFNTTAGPTESAINLYLPGKSLKWLDDQRVACVPYLSSKTDEWRKCLREPPPDLITLLDKLGVRGSRADATGGSGQ
jgi:hypothetical protein